MRYGLQAESSHQGLLVRSVVFWVGVFLSLLCVAMPQFRYLFFGLPFLVLIATLGDRGGRIGDELKPFLAFVAAGLALSPLAGKEGLKDLFLTFSGISTGLLLTVPRIKPVHAFAAITLAAVLYFAQVFGLSSSIRFNIEESSSPFESNFSFIYGLLAVFALAERRRWLFLLCVVLAVVTLKRIAVLGALLCAAFILIGEARGRKILNPPVMLLINVAILLFLLAFGAGFFDSTIRDLTGQSANHFAQGRRSILELPALEVMRAPEQFVLFGQGPGSTYDLAAKGALSYSRKTNLHSDLIKLFYEYGFVFYCVFIWLLYAAKSYRTRVACLYMNVLFVTDNVLIYYFFLLMFVVGVRSLGPSESEPAAPASTA